MAEVPNQKVIEKYRDLLTTRTHDVIVMQLAIEMLEQKVAELVNQKNAVDQENTRLQQIVEQAEENKIVPGEVLERKDNNGIDV